MKTNKKYQKYIYLVVLLIAFLVQGMYIISDTLTLSLFEKIIIVVTQGIGIIGFTHYHNIGLPKEMIQRNILLAQQFVFILYSLNLVYVLFLDKGFGRGLMHYTNFDEYLKYNVNFELFGSIKLFVNGYYNGYVTLETLVRNLLGNFIVFMPMAYFLPIFFKKQRKWIWFIVTIFFMVFSVELLQVLLRSGSGDIDDLFLNVLGAILIYGLLRIMLPYKNKE